MKNNSDMRKKNYSRVIGALLIPSMSVGVASAQVFLEPGVPVPAETEPAVPPRQLELINWMNLPGGDDIALMAIEFEPQVLPGLTASEMSEIYTALNSGTTEGKPLAEFLVTVQQGDPAAMKRAIAAVATKDSKDAEALFLGGLWAEAKEGDSAAAIQWFLAARGAAEDEADKSLIDRYILGSALLADPSDDPARKAGAEAALRLAGSFWNGGSGTARALGSMLKDFGDVESAEKVMTKAGTPAVGQPVMRGRRRSGYSEVVNAFAAGDKEGGIAIAVAGVTEAASAFAQSGSQDNINYNYRQMADFVAAYGLSGVVLEKMKPKDGASSQERTLFAFAAELLHKPDIALPAYRKLLAGDASLYGVRWRLIVNSIGEPLAQELLKDFPPEHLQQYGYTLSNLLQNEQDFFRRLALVELIQAFLDTVEPDETGNLRWVENIMSPLADDFYSEDIRVMSIYRPDGSYGYDNEAQELRSKNAAERRLELHTKFCESMLRHPALASSGFASISGFAGMPGRRTEAEFSAMARELIGSTHTPDQTFYYSDPSNSSYVPQLQPAQFLFRQAVDAGSMEMIDTEIIPMAEKSGKNMLAGSMRAFSKLYSCDPSDFVEVATAVVEEGVDGVDPDSLVNYVQSTAQQRDITVDLGPLVLSTIRKVRDQSSNVPYSAANFTTTTYNAGGAEAARAFINGVAEIYLGPVEGQREFVTKNFSQGYQSGKPSAKIYAFKEFLERFSSPMGLTVLAVEKYVSCGYGPLGDNDMANRFEYAVRSSRFDDNYSVTLQMLDESPWLKDVDQFQVWPLRYLSAGSCYGHLIQQMQQCPSTVRKRMLDHVASAKPATFGAKLTLACFDSDPQAAVAGVFSTSVQKLEKLPVDQQKNLAAWFSQFLERQGGIQRKTPQMDSVNKWVASLAKPQKAGDNPGDQAVTTSAMAQAFLEAKNPGEASTSMQLHQHVVPILVSVADQPDVCARVFTHYRKLAAMPQRVGGRRSPGEDSYESQVLAAFVQQVEPNRTAQGRSFAPLVAIFQSEAGRTVVPGQALNSMLSSVFAATRSDVSPGIGAFLEAAATPEKDTIAALLLAPSAPYRQRGRTVYGIRLSNLAEMAKANGWSRTASALSGNEAELVTQLIADDSAPVGLRLLATAATPLDTDETISMVVNLAITAFDQGGQLPPEGLFALIDSYLQREPDDANPEWERIGRRLLHGAVQSLQPGSITAEQFIGMLSAAGKVGYSSRRVQMRFGQNFAREPWMLAMLVKFRQFAAARQQLQSQLAQMQMPQVPPPAGTAVIPSGNVESRSINTLPDGRRRITEGYDTGEQIVYIEDQFGNRTIEGTGGGAAGPVAFDESLATTIPDFVATIEEPGLAALAELILLATPDPGKENEVVDLEDGDEDAEPAPPVVEESGVRQRVIAAAERIADQKVDNPFIEERILSILAPVALELPALRERIADYGRNVDVVALAMFEDENIKQPRQRIFKAYLEGALVHQPDEFATIMESLLTAKSSRDYRVVRALQFYGNGFPDVLFQSASGFDRAKAARYVPLFRRLLEVGGTNEQWQKRLDCLNGAIICHVLAGKSAEFTSWFASLDESLQLQFRSQVQLLRLLQLISKPLSSSGMPEEERIAIVGSLMEAKVFPPDANASTSGVQGLQGGSDKLFKSLVDDGVLTAAAVVEHGPRWAEMNPRNGAAWAEVANFQMAAGDEEKALESWVFAVTSVPWDNRKSYTEYHLEAARLLLKMNRIDPALTWFEFFNRGRLYEDSALEFETLYRDTRYKVMMRQGRMQELVDDALSGLQRTRNDTASWHQLGSVFDALGRRRLAEGKTQQAVSMLEFALLVLSKTSAENPALGIGQVNELFDVLMEAKAANGELADSVSFISKESEWNYFYSTAASDGWYLPGFDDSDWKQGRGQLGYGDDDETTLLEWGNDPDHKPITAYFRKTFTVEAPENLKSLSIDLVRDDGAVVYLNGAEVRRDNMPSGKIQFSTEAPSSPKKAEENNYVRTSIDTGHLKAGLNVIAVEVHQNDPDSSDLSFDLQLVSNVPTADETVRAVEIGDLQDRLGKCTPPFQLEDWAWEILDEARQPKQRGNVIFEEGFEIDTSNLVVPDILRRQPSTSSRRVIAPSASPK
ncbi:MAG: hypothetical protein R3F19_17110 [Verrucomicrobiales bacterium]